MAVSLAGLQKHKAYAVYDGEALIITHVVRLQGLFGAWKDPLIEEIESKRKDGYVCVVEEKTDHIAKYGSQFNLEDTDGETGRSNLYVALDWYFPMLEMGHIVVAKEFQQYLIRSGAEGQKIEKGQDEKGRAVYSINWAAVNTGHRSILLCVVGAMIEPVSDRYLDDMLGRWLAEERNENPLTSFEDITIGSTMRRVEDRAEWRRNRT
jgi:hypothetical protein